MFRPVGDKGDVTNHTGQCNASGMRLIIFLTAPLLLIGCDMLNSAQPSVAPAAEPASAIESEASETVTPTDASPRTALSTVASLGDPGRGGMWLETPLVQQETPGRVRVVSSGASAAVTLIPIKGPATAGSRLSLAAMRELGASLGDLVTLEISIGS